MSLPAGGQTLFEMPQRRCCHVARKEWRTLVRLVRLVSLPARQRKEAVRRSRLRQKDVGPSRSQLREAPFLLDAGEDPGNPSGADLSTKGALDIHRTGEPTFAKEARRPPHEAVILVVPVDRDGLLMDPIEDAQLVAFMPSNLHHGRLTIRQRTFAGLDAVTRSWDGIMLVLPAQVDQDLYPQQTTSGSKVGHAVGHAFGCLHYCVHEGAKDDD